MKTYETAAISWSTVVYPHTPGVVGRTALGLSAQYNVYVQQTHDRWIHAPGILATCLLACGLEGKVVQSGSRTYLRSMHDSGLWHRDMVTSNVC